MSYVLAQIEDILDGLKRALSYVPEEEKASVAWFVVAGFALGIGATAVLFAPDDGKGLGDLCFDMIVDEVRRLTDTGPYPPDPYPRLPS